MDLPETSQFGVARENENIVSLIRPRCAQLFFVYAGRRGYAGMPILGLLRDAGIGDRNVTLLRDPSDGNYIDGLGEQLPDLAAVVDWHRGHVDRLAHVQQTYCLGNSSGGVAALLFGHALRVDTVWAFAPRPSGMENYHFINRELCDLLGEDNGVTNFFIYYSPSNDLDHGVVEELAGCPRVTLIEDGRLQGRAGHMVMMDMARRGELRDVFPPFLPAVDS